MRALVASPLPWGATPVLAQAATAHLSPPIKTEKKD